MQEPLRYFNSVGWPLGVALSRKLSSGLLWVPTFFFLSVAFVSARPLADEHLQAGLVQGILVDSALGFDVTHTDLANRLLNALRFMVLNGWDSATNSATLQLVPAVLNLYFGTWGTRLLCLLTLATVLWFSGRWNRRVLCVRSHEGNALLILGLVAAVWFGTFNHHDFGIFVFTGVRFSVYLIHTLLFAYWIVHFAPGRNSPSASIGFTLICLSTWSLWFCSIWAVLTILKGCSPKVIHKITGSELNRVDRRKHLFIFIGGTAFVALNNGSFVGIADRMSQQDGSAWLAIGKLGIHLASFPTLQDIGRLAFGPHFWIGLFFGLSIRRYTNASSGLSRSEEASRIKTVSIDSVVLILIVNLLFQVQEFVTYPAYWHRTLPITFTYLMATRIGSVMPPLPSVRGLQTHQTNWLLRRVSLLVVGCFSIVAVNNGVRLLDSHATSYDSGNITSVGFSVSNEQDWVYETLLNIPAPYRPIGWRPPKSVLESIDVVVEAPAADGSTAIQVDSDAIGGEIREFVLQHALTLKILDSRYSEEFNHLIRLTISVFNPSRFKSTIEVHGENLQKFLIPANSTSEFSFETSLPGEAKIYCNRMLCSPLIQVRSITVGYPDSVGFLLN